METTKLKRSNPAISAAVPYHQVFDEVCINEDETTFSKPQCKLEFKKWSDFVDFQFSKSYLVTHTQNTSTLV